MGVSKNSGNSRPPADARKEVHGLAKSTQRKIAEKPRDESKTQLLLQTGKAGGNPVHRRLKFHEKKLLKNHDYMQYDSDLWHEPYCISKYALKDREDYRRYLRLVGMVRSLMTQMRYLPADSKIRIEITNQLVEKLYNMGLVNDRMGLAEVDKVGVEAFCKRRLPSVMVDLKMAANCKFAQQFAEQGHVRCGTTQIRDGAFLVPRGMDDQVTWTETSRIKKHVDRFNARHDDFEG